MRAGVITGKETLELREVPRPEPTADKAVVEISRCGICGTDVHAYQFGAALPPAVCGHEWTGTVSACAPGVRNVREGDRVAIGMAPACGHCAPCAAGDPDHCAPAMASLVGVSPMSPPHGGFAPAIAVEAARLYKVRPELSDDQAALLEPATILVHALRLCRVRLGDRAVVLGAGPIGLLALQLVRVAGAGPVVVIEPDPQRGRIALGLGADAVMTPQAEGLEEQLREYCGPLGPDLVLECAGVPDTIQRAVELVRSGGSVGMVGLAASAATIQPLDWLVKEVRVQAALGYTHAEFEMSQQLVADGRLNLEPLVTDHIPLDQLEDGLRRLMRPDGGIKIIVDPSEG